MRDQRDSQPFLTNGLSDSQPILTNELSDSQPILIFLFQIGSVLTPRNRIVYFDFLIDLHCILRGYSILECSVANYIYCQTLGGWPTRDFVGD